MKKKSSYTHPMNLYPQRIKEEGIVVFNDVRGLPSGDEPFVSPDYVICIGHMGRINLMYDDITDLSEQRTVGVIFPNHRLLKVDKTDDYRATLIVVRAALLNDPMLQIINQLRYRYEPHPNVKLDRHEYKMITNVVEGMCEITRLKLPDHQMLMMRLLEFLLRLLSHYRRNKLNETPADKRVSAHFHNDLKQYFRKHRDVSFYAEKACLSSKHFSAVIKQETGQTAAYWIHRQVVAEAKMLLHVRRDLSVQVIADMLGFEEQSTFSRYFRRETGMSPSDFRNSQ
ncbi:MAG: AraC family transcriptional regulator [Bacteroidales bacterium]|nr:AraC family transcriptional regulator [Bacteroidales bacterium]MBQ5993768.1 AraC family transcriptional regulator [Bacteroidales bacterium]